MIDIATIAFNTPWVIEEQIRLIGKYVTDEHELSVYDNSSKMDVGWQIGKLCEAAGIRYVMSPTKQQKHTHESALKHACDDLLNRQAPFICFLDHDVFPTAPVSLEALAANGVFGVQQSCTAGTYLWPGLLVIRRSWLDGRPRLNLGSVPGGDVGSALTAILTQDDLDSIPLVDYGYEPVMDPDDRATQAWTVERIGSFRHLTNASNWLALPNFHARERAVRTLVEAL